MRAVRLRRYVTPAAQTSWSCTGARSWVEAGAAAAPGPAAPAGATQPAPLRIFLRGGPKTHGPADNGLHDGPTWLKEWQPLLEARGAKVAGALRFPTADELENADVLVMFTAD